MQPTTTFTIEANMKKRIAPSILSADFTRLGDDIRAVEAAGADWIHIDVMDGCFVPNITIGALVVSAVKRVTGLPLDVHLMIQDPDRYIPEFADAGAYLISVHIETCPHLNRTIEHIKSKGCLAGVALNPATPLCALDWVLENVDLVLIMSVNPGFGGQAFIPNTIDKITRLRQTIDGRGLSTLIQVDGGINATTIKDIAKAGADVFVAGSAIFGDGHYGEKISALRKQMEDAPGSAPLRETSVKKPE